MWADTFNSTAAAATSNQPSNANAASVAPSPSTPTHAHPPPIMSTSSPRGSPVSSGQGSLMQSPRSTGHRTRGGGRVPYVAPSPTQSTQQRIIQQQQTTLTHQRVADSSSSSSSSNAGLSALPAASSSISSNLVVPTFVNIESVANSTSNTIKQDATNNPESAIVQPSSTSPPTSTTRLDAPTPSTTLASPSGSKFSPTTANPRPLPKVVHRASVSMSPIGSSSPAAASLHANAAKLSAPSASSSIVSPSTPSGVESPRPAEPIITNPSNTLHSPSEAPAFDRAHTHAGSSMDDPYDVDSSKSFPILTIGTPLRSERPLSAAETAVSTGRAGNPTSPVSPGVGGKRTHQSWSLPARGSVSGSSGFSSSLFRPMLQKEIIQTHTSPLSPSRSTGTGKDSHKGPTKSIDSSEVRIHIPPQHSTYTALTTSPTNESQKLRERPNIFGQPASPTAKAATETRPAAAAAAKLPPTATPSCMSRALSALASFPTRIPHTQTIATAMFHPVYLTLMFLIALIGVFALDFQLSFFHPSSDLATDVLLLVIGALWSLEFFTLSVVLPGYLLTSFWWWVDALSIISIVVDISLLRGLGMEYAPFRLFEDGSYSAHSFQGLSHAGYARVWLFLHLVRIVRLFKYWNGVDGFGGRLSLVRLFSRLSSNDSSAPRIHVEGASAVFHKSSTLGMHLTNRMQKKVTSLFIGIILVMTLLSPTATLVKTRSVCASEGIVAVDNAFSMTYGPQMAQWAIGYLDGLYSSAVKQMDSNGSMSPSTANLMAASDYQSANRFISSLQSTFGEQLLFVSLAVPTSKNFPNPSIFVGPSAALDSLRNMEVDSFSCGASVLLLDGSPRVRALARWDILLLVFLSILYVITTSCVAFDIASLVSQPLERMSKIVRKMAGTVLFLQSESDPTCDPWSLANRKKKKSRRESSQKEYSRSSNVELSRIGPSSKSSTGTFSSSVANRDVPFVATCPPGASSSWLSPYVPARFEFDLLEEVVAKMSNVFNLLPGGLSSLLNSGAEGEDKARRVMVGSRRTEIKTRDSILTIDVVERPITHANVPGAPAVTATTKAATKREPAGKTQNLVGLDLSDDSDFISNSTLLNLPAGIHQKLTATNTMQNPAGRASIHHSLAGNSALRFEAHPELRSLEQLLADPLASLHFKQYLHKKFCLETLAFYEQVTKFKSRMQSWAFRIYHQYVVAGAPNEINIHSAQRTSISSEIFHPTLDTFNSAQKEVFKLMKNNFLEFLVSQACVNYLAAKQTRQVTIKVGEGQL